MEKMPHPYEDRWISMEEAQKISDETLKEMERVAKRKAPDDYAFNDMFNGYIEGKHYSSETGVALFIQFEQNFDNLYCYYQYTKRFIASFVNQAYENYRQLEEEGFAEAAYDYQELTDINYQSVLLMAYTTFESLLRDYIEVIDERAGVLKYPYDDRTTLKYLKFLHYDKGVFIPRKLFQEFNEIRLVRNYFAHSLEKAQAQLVRNLKKNDPCQILIGETYIILNEEYMEYAFNILGKIVRAMEMAFERYYIKNDD